LGDNGDDALPLGMVVSAFIDSADAGAVRTTECVRCCQNCGAYPTRYTPASVFEDRDENDDEIVTRKLVSGEKASWFCLFCSQWQEGYENASQRDYVAELSNDVIEFSSALANSSNSSNSSSSSSSSNYDSDFGGDGDQDRPQCIDRLVLLVDGQLDSVQHVDALQNGVFSALDRFGAPDAPFDGSVALLIFFASHVMAFELGGDANAPSVAHAFPVARALGECERQVVDDVDRRGGWWASTVDASGKRAVADALQMALGKRRRALERRQQNVAVSRERAFAGAVHVATAIGGGDRHRRMLTRVALFSNGSPHSDEVSALLSSERIGVDDFRVQQRLGEFERVAAHASRRGVGVDFYALGHGFVHTRALHALVRPTNGVVVTLRNVDAASVAGNLVESLHARPASLSATLQFYCSSDAVRFTHLIGPLAVDDDDGDGDDGDDNDSDDGEGDNRWLWQRWLSQAKRPARRQRWRRRQQQRWRTSGDRNHSVALCMALADDLVDEDSCAVFFQVVARHRGKTRVASARVASTSKRAEFVRGIDAHVAAVLAGKQSVAQARRDSRAVDATQRAQAHIDRIMTSVSKAHTIATPEPATHLYNLPAPLLPLPRLLFSLRQSALLSDVLQHDDDIDALRCLYIDAPFDAALRMQSPELLMLDSAQPELFQMIACDITALRSDCVLLFDEHISLFVWRGANATGAMHEAAMHRAHALAANRFPRPSIMSFDEHASMARWLRARLNPSHQDPWHDQIRQSPQLASLAPEQRRQLLSRFHLTNALSYYQWASSLSK
jgi:hypothetical protein